MTIKDTEREIFSWEPCNRCEGCKSCVYYLNGRSECIKCEGQNYISSTNFCPHCGRPLKDKAWDIFKKRLEGHKNEL